ncbi:MAG: hypothetical protein GTO24_01450 [candidate division Zixibacteria bacterium]|nr:hypothetical protein [candidate division Zixibacteria bacterium]
MSSEKSEADTNPERNLLWFYSLRHKFAEVKAVGEWLAPIFRVQAATGAKIRERKVHDWIVKIIVFPARYPETKGLGPFGSVYRTRGFPEI